MESVMTANDRGPKVLFGVLILVLLIGAVLGGGMMGPGMMGPGMMGGYGGTQPSGAGWMWGLTMGFGMLLMVAFWVAVILGVVLLVRWAIGTTSRVTDEPRSEHPLDILRRRYAAGEIDQATYQRMQRELEGGAENRSRETVVANGRGK
jgi:putative membrane protein